MKQCAIAGCAEYAESDRKVTFDNGLALEIPVCDAHDTESRVAGKWAILSEPRKAEGDWRLIAGRRTNEPRIAKLGNCPKCGFAGCDCRS
jgi:hypothetical protein